MSISRTNVYIHCLLTNYFNLTPSRDFRILFYFSTFFSLSFNPVRNFLVALSHKLLSNLPTDKKNRKKGKGREDRGLLA